MTYLMYLLRLRKRSRPKISLLIPFTTNDPYRKATFKWLMDYWKCELPDAEIVIGKSKSKPFNKGEALNNALRKSRGEVIVILDADAYMQGKWLDDGADLILEYIADGQRMWLVPYRHLYRLSESATKRITSSNPCDPVRMPSPPRKEDLDKHQQHSKYGHRYGAMAMMFPREAIDAIGGYFDERFCGWGGEDVALLRALDTLYAKHKTTRNSIYHLWHPVKGKTLKDRVWEHQDEQNNKHLANSYNRATRQPDKMRDIVDEGRKYTKRRRSMRAKITRRITRH